MNVMKNVQPLALTVEVNNMSRTVTIHLNEIIPAHGEQCKAIGYLSTWALPTYPTVDIYPDGPAKEGREQDMVAVYSVEQTEGKHRQFVMGAICGADSKYSFHS
jgi:hypothetical protein